MELKHLRYFVAVAEHLNFSAAARELFISQQALSRIVQQLEHELGVRLLDRTTRSVSLTPAGQAFLPSARRSIAFVDASVESVRRQPQQPRPLRVDISSFGLRIPADFLRTLRRRQPEQPIHQAEIGVPRGLTALAEGRLDALLGLATHCPPDIPSEVVGHEPVLLGMSADHPLASLPEVPVSLLADIELLLPSQEAAGEWVEFVHGFCAEAAVTPRRWPGSTHGSNAAAEVLREYGVVTPTAAWDAPPDDLVFRPLVGPSPNLTWSLMISPVSVADREMDMLVDAARDRRRQSVG